MHKVLSTLKLSLLHIGLAELDHRWQFDNVISPFSRLYLITKGEAWVLHNQKKYILRPNRLYLIPNFTYSKYHCDNLMDQYYISFLDSMEGGMSVYDLLPFTYETEATSLDHHLMQRLLSLNPGRTILESDPKTYDNKPDLLSYNLNSSQSYDQYLESQGILLQLFSRFIQTGRLQSEKQLKSYRRLASVIQYIDKHLSEKLTVEQLANSVYLHPDYFSRLFLEINGVRPLDFINNKRLERSQILLATSDLTIAEVAMEIGLPNVSYFNRLFKKKFHLTPSAFRKMGWNRPV